MLSKIITSALLICVTFYGNVAAYDLPKIKPDKKITAKNGEVQTNRRTMFVSDWTETNRFIARLQTLTAENKKLPPNSPERVSYDKNRVFIAFYKGNAYFLDKYTVEVKTDADGSQSWTQRIFPIGKGISPKNSVATTQRFFFDGQKGYNALNKNYPLDAVADADDKKFLTECFKIGYYFAFGKDLNQSKDLDEDK